MCPFCFCHFETGDHMLLECNFSEAIWHIIASKYHLPSYNSLMSKGRLRAWVNHFANEGNKQVRKIKLGILVSFWWHLWKERNRRIFDSKEQYVPQLADAIQGEIDLFHRANSINLC
jgi:hypothetical protein